MGSYASKDDIHCHRICISHTNWVWLFLSFTRAVSFFVLCLALLPAFNGLWTTFHTQLISLT
ncbi:hypothetical protein AL540_005640 [Vibrio harveyi]|uniref:Uncharacterized protein n=1 Tax=Vibrio harveyi TaxID=669 RepID=A0A8B3DH47_VIBHA|nr:hypothetical protein BG259_18455 [Vibrio harveyi]PNM62504.1 hypothetical protein AL540_005640 [Vibrio harveyi]QFQ81103.1 hypothetical protein F9277_27460 [Vibrio harveyi]RCR60519.1 hypothetical protein DTW68_20540 [Vibrio harveyi]RIW11658.1 hypothetical protein DS957_014770 [Vibrio harveyi]